MTTQLLFSSVLFPKGDIPFAKRKDIMYIILNCILKIGATSNAEKVSSQRLLSEQPLVRLRLKTVKD